MGDIRTLDTGTDYVLGTVIDGVATLTLNRPESLNSLHPQIFEGLGRMLPLLAEDPEVGALVLTGAGRAFCSGGDVKAQSARAEKAAESGGGTATPAAASAMTEARIDDLRRRQAAVSAAIYEFPKVTIASLRGAAAGAGMSIALSTDLRIGSENAFFTTAFAKVGFSGDFGGSWFLTQLLGAAKAKELYLTSDRVPAAEALRLGLLNRVVPDGELEEATMAWARTFANGPRLAYRYMKENLDRALQADLRTCLDGEAVAMTRTGLSEDHREAAKAFVEKRTPNFVGR